MDEIIGNSSEDFAPLTRDSVVRFDQNDIIEEEDTAGGVDEEMEDDHDRHHDHQTQTQTHHTRHDTTAHDKDERGGGDPTADADGGGPTIGSQVYSLQHEPTHTLQDVDSVITGKGGGAEKSVTGVDANGTDLRRTSAPIVSENQPTKSQQLFTRVANSETALSNVITEQPPTKISPNQTAVTHLSGAKATNSSTPPPPALTADLATAAALHNAIPVDRREGGYVATNDTFFKDRELASGQAEWYHIAFWAVGCIISALFFSWNKGLQAGFGTFTIASIITTIAYGSMTTSLAEMASALPFSGGSYGFARATMGKGVGMFVGLAESLEYVLTTAVNQMLFGSLCSMLFGTSVYFDLLWIFFSYVISVGAHIYGGRTYWHMTVIMVTFDCLLILLYCFGCLQFIDYSSWAQRLAPDQTSVDSGPGGYFINGFTGFMTVLPISTWWYTGIEAMPLACEETKDAKTNVPKGMIRGMIAVVIFNVLVYFVCVSVAVDTSIGQLSLYASDFPMLAGLQKLFHATNYDNPVLLLIMIQGMFVSAFGFVFAYGRQVYAMSRSGLLPTCLSLVHPQYGTPYVSIIGGSCLGYLICVVGRVAFPLTNDFSYFKTHVYNTMLMVALINYLCQLSCFIIIRRQYGLLTRRYRSPFGVTGAIVGIVIFFLTLIALLGWSLDIWIPVTGCAIYFAIGMSYYFIHARHHMLLSPEEQIAMFMIYSINFLRRKQADKAAAAAGLAKPRHAKSGANKSPDQATSSANTVTSDGIKGITSSSFELDANMVRTIEKHGEALRAKAQERARRASAMQAVKMKREDKQRARAAGRQTAFMRTTRTTAQVGGGTTQVGTIAMTTMGGTKLSTGITNRSNGTTSPFGGTTLEHAVLSGTNPTSGSTGTFGGGSSDPYKLRSQRSFDGTSSGNIMSLPGGVRSDSMISPKALKLVGTDSAPLVPLAGGGGGGEQSGLGGPSVLQRMVSSVGGLSQTNTTANAGTRNTYLTALTIPDQPDTQLTGANSQFADPLVTNIYVSTVQRREFNPLDNDEGLASTFSHVWLQDHNEEDGGLMPIEPLDDASRMQHHSIGGSGFINSHTTSGSSFPTLGRTNTNHRTNGELPSILKSRGGMSGMSGTRTANTANSSSHRLWTIARKQVAIKPHTVTSSSTSSSTAVASMTTQQMTDQTVTQQMPSSSTTPDPIISPASPTNSSAQETQNSLVEPSPSPSSPSNS